MVNGYRSSISPARQTDKWGTRPRARGVLLVIVLLGVTTAAEAQPALLGAEFLVSTYTAVKEREPRLGAGASGAFVAVWESQGQDGNGIGVFGQRFDSTGAASGSEFQVNTATVGDQLFPAVAVGGGDDFVVIWDQHANILPLVDYPRVVGQRFASDGTPIGTAFQVNTYTLTGISGSDVAYDTAGNFVIVWSSYQIQGQRFDSNGNPQGSEFKINASEYTTVWDPAVQTDGLGNFIVVWTDTSSEIRGRRFASGGASLGSEFEVNVVPYDPGGIDSTRPHVGADDNGSFVVVWAKRTIPENDDPTVFEILGRRFDSSGQVQGGEFTVARGGRNYFPDVAMSPAGDFVVIWATVTDSVPGDDYPVHVFARRYSNTGTSVGGEVQVNTTALSDHLYPQVEASAPGEFVSVWVFTPPGGSSAVLGQRLTTVATTPICEMGPVMASVKVKLGKLGPPAGDETVLIKGSVPFSVGTPATFDPTADGAQVLIEDLGSGEAVLYELSNRTQAVPGGAGCGADAWTVNGSGTTHKYKNESGAFPPGCVAGSANGLTQVAFKDKRAQKGAITVKLKAKNATIATPIGPLRASIVLGASAAQGTAGECGAVSFATTACTIKEKTVSCAIK